MRFASARRRQKPRLSRLAARIGNKFPFLVDSKTVYQEEIESLVDKTLPKWIPPGTAPAARRLLSLDRAAETYFALKSEAGREPITQKLLRHFQVTYSAPEGDLEKIPRSGPVIAVANHPSGILDGAVLVTLLTQVRPDVRILANSLLSSIPELAGLVIPVDLEVHEPNPAAARRALNHLKDGGMLIVFPAGEVAHFQWKRLSVSDSAWNEGVARLIEIAVRLGHKPAIVPIHVSGRNGALFHAAGIVHRRFRTALLARELLNKQRARIRVRIGTAVEAERLLSIQSNAERIQYLRWRTDILASEAAIRARTRRPLRFSGAAVRQPVADETAPELVARDIERLDPSSLLLSSGDFQVYLAKSENLPNVLRELGRLRENTFRAAGEGSGRSLDLDRFDLHYLHLLLWNSRKQEIAGAYRLAITDDVVRERGIEGLYTATLFRYGSEFLRQIGPAIELGRSFIRAEYQRSFSPLLLLWKGIGRFVADHAECKCLFGPVSISNQYRTVSRDLIIRFFERSGSMETWSGLVRARNAPPRSKVIELCTDFEDLSSIVADLEPTRSGVPVLLRQYVKLGGRLLSFNVDPEFSGVLDGLMLVDLRHTETRLLERYLGKDATAHIRAIGRNSWE